jgi:anti-sigma factor ChrR (cupin superfamily)
MEPGAVYPTHRHAEVEEIYVLDGDLSVDGETLGAGDYCTAAAGSTHRAPHTRGGCRFIAFSSGRDEFLAQVPAGPVGDLLFVHERDTSWRPARPGLDVKAFVSPTVAGLAMTLVRVRPGGTIPAHRHLSAEQGYVLAGDRGTGALVLGAGDYWQAPAGTLHEEMRSEGGCTYLLLACGTETVAP